MKMTRGYRTLSTRCGQNHHRSGATNSLSRRVRLLQHTSLRVHQALASYPENPCRLKANEGKDRCSLFHLRCFDLGHLSYLLDVVTQQGLEACRFGIGQGIDVTPDIAAVSRPAFERAGGRQAVVAACEVNKAYSFHGQRPGEVV
jgi:hypothetical protein